MQEKGIARNGYSIKNFDGDIIGNVTSGTQSPSLGKAIGMGYIDKRYTEVGTEIYISIRTNLLKALVVKIPFE